MTSLVPDLPVSSALSCPLCHTAALDTTGDSIATGGTWTCPRCGQLWDGKRLATVAAYAKYVADEAGPRAR